MNENVIKQIIADSIAKQKEYIKYVKESLDSLTIPQHIPTVEKQERNTSSIPTACCIGGTVLLVGGVCLSKLPVTLIGGTITAAGLVLMNKAKSSDTSTTTHVAIDFFAINEKIYKKMEEIDSHISKDWSDVINRNMNEIQTVVQSLNIDSDTKGKLIDKSILKSTIAFSLSDVLSALNSIESEKDLQKLHQYINILGQEYKTAINSAIEKQIEIYRSLESTYSF